MITAAGPPRFLSPAPSGQGTRALAAAALVVAAAFVGAGVLGLLPAARAALLAVVVSHGVYCCLLARAARRAGRYGRAQRARTIQWLAAALGLTAVDSAGAAVAQVVAPDVRVASGVPLPAEILLVGLFFVVGAYLLGLPRTRRAGTQLARAAQWLGGAAVGVFAFLLGWILVFLPAGMRGAGLTAALLASIAVAVLTAVGSPELSDPAGTPRLAAGAVTSVAGAAGLTIALDYPAPRAWPLVAALCLVAGPLVLYDGLRRFAPDTAPGAITGPDVHAGRVPYPLALLPMVAAAVAAGYHLLQQRRFDTLSIELGLTGMALVTLREWAAGREARRYAARVADQDASLRSLVAGSSDMTMVLDTALLVRWQSSAAARQFGLSDQDVLGRPVVTLLHPQDVDQVAACLTELADKPGSAQVGLLDVRMRDGFGTWRDTEWSVTRSEPGSAGWSLVVHVRDVSQHKELERTLRRTAETDRLTGLANRQGLRSAAAVREYRALILISLGITAVNNVKGHEVGDAALVEAARRLRATVSYTDMAGRLEAATFAVLTEAGAVQAHLLATRLLTVLSEPYAVPGSVAHLPANAGLADLTADVDLDEALRRAELALHGTRGRKGSRAVEWYDEATQAQLRKRLAIQHELPGAIARGELDLVYQPVIALSGGYPVGAEALLRWRHPTLGPVPPAEFIPIAEELGLLDEITQWVLHWACRQLSIWARDGRDLWLSVNVAAATVATPAFVPAVSTSLETHLVPAARLVIEVAEQGITDGGVASADARLMALVDHLTELRALGVRTAVDHFGTGATSLSQLRVLPLDLIKIDRQIFGEPAGRSGVVTAIVDVVVKLGRHIGLEVIAQGLESAADLAVARAAGCGYGQGFAVSRPEPPEHVEAYLDAHRAPRT